MKKLLRSLKRLTRSKIDEQIEALHAESRAEIAKKIAMGKGREGLDESAAHLGLSRKSGERPKMIFGGGKVIRGAKRSG